MAAGGKLKQVISKVICSRSDIKAKIKESHVRTICFCNSNIPWGGGEKWHYEAAASLALRGWRVLMICHPKGALLERAKLLPGVQAIPLELGRLSFLNPLKRMWLTRFFRQEKVDSLIMNLPADLKVAGPAARSAGVGHIVYRRGSALPVRDSALNRRLYGKVITRLIVNSEATRRLVLVNNPDLIPAERVTVLPNGIDVQRFDEALAAAEAEARNGKNGTLPCCDKAAAQPRPFTLGNAGRLNVQKGQHLLLHLAGRLVDAGLDCRVVIAGEGERENELRSLAAELGVADRTLFCGFMPDLAPFWNGIDLFVLTSLWEGFGNVLIEAMLAQKPVFAFAVSNIPELVTDGVNGRLFPLPEEELRHCPDAVAPNAASAGASATPDNAHAPAASSSAVMEDGGMCGESGSPQNRPYKGLDALAKAVCELAASPAEQRRMGQAGRGFARQFSQDFCMDALEGLLQMDTQQ